MDGRFLLCSFFCSLSLLCAACDTSSKTSKEIQATTDSVAAQTTAPTTSAQAAPNPTLQETRPEITPPPTTTPRSPAETALPPLSDPQRHLIALAEEFHRASQASPEKASTWLLKHAQFPFDFDGKIRVQERAAFQETLQPHLPKFFTQLTPYTTCEALSRAEILDGKPWHYVDRLGLRPPKEELQRDLDRFGLRDQDWLVNCYAGEEAGFFLVVTLSKETSSIKALRN